MDAVVGPDIGVGADVFSQHAGLLAADSTLLTDVFASSPSTYVNILLIGLVSVRWIEKKSCMRNQLIQEKKNN